jgi:hypothetical protein
MGYDHFTVNNLRYHGRDLTVVWDKPDDGKRYYPRAPEGYSAYVDGERAFTVDDLARVTWDSRTGSVETDARVRFASRMPVAEATRVSLAGDERVADMFQKAGVDLTGHAENVAAGRPAAASFTEPDTAATHAVDGFTLSGPTVRPGFYGPNPSYGALNPIWGTRGSPNAQDWLELDLGRHRKLDMVRLYFFSDKEFGAGPPQGPRIDGNTYREPASYTVQHQVGKRWVDARGQVRTPASPWPNYNQVRFRPVAARRLRILMTPTPGYGIGLKEVQAFDR